MAYFESPEFSQLNRESLHHFIAVDDITLSSLPDSESYDPSGCTFILASASAAIVWHRDADGDIVASDYVGYGYGRCAIGWPGPYSAWVNLSVGNMDLFELIERTGDETDEYGLKQPKKVYWSNYTHNAEDEVEL